MEQELGVDAPPFSYWELRRETFSQKIFMFKSLHIYNIWSNFMIQFNRPTYITLCCPEINLATQYKVTLVNKTLLKALLCSTHHSCVSERPNLWWYLYSSKSFRAGGFFGDFLETVVPQVDLNTTAPPPTSSPLCLWLLPTPLVI